MLKTEKEYQELANFLYDLLHATNWEDGEIQELFRTFEALREVARYCKENAGDEFDEMFPEFPDWLTDG